MSPPLILGPEDPPVLPSPRPRPLTPSDDNNLTMHPQGESPFFNRLPLEIRLQIYGFLFGDRTLHIELSYDRPKTKGLRHAGWSGEASPDRRVEWRWISCACCDKHDVDGIAHDPSACKVNAKWLLTCRKGYSESIAILYKTNTFNVPFSIYTSPRDHQQRTLGYLEEGSHHVPFLSRGIPSHRFSTITSLEVISWYIDEPPRPSDPLALAAYEMSWRELVLPGLRKLRVAADTKPFPNGMNVSVGVEAAWFGIVDDIVSEKRLDLEFKLPLSWFLGLRRGGIVESWHDSNDYRTWRYWRNVGLDEATDGWDANPGYWVTNLG
ncbi:uncharacterized protein K452DRAFT_305788 [Aplosporella prunicola CBS 121167]|uniref:DUF7730 domain-containing protein n=1 Tax=Aplosporella prunicola CBS 121167 TaxID=1176127 RepID=A0A6A6BP49_9PEZI|nr:uncharacterized protein K452DRAFT_305788 [Aplosporella prunicola CBS 121167]KAF2145846.1 hypothetical protein K452DRAFT_305788 [Aplosporella prunicola CBS 121167]